jgi:methylamine dehydrogenase heavy chain
MTKHGFAGALTLALLAGAAQAATYKDPLPAEPIPTVAELVPNYPASWVYVQDLHFNSLPDGRAAIVDVAAEAHALKGQVPVAQFGTLLPATTRPDIYVAETFFSRMTRGERTDVITIWDKATLKTKGEIVLPGGKRGQFVTLRNSFQLVNGEKWALLFNFTPASSVSVIDLDARKVINEIDLPGCSLIYPSGSRGFTSLCADGTMTSIDLDADAKVVGSTTSSKPINDIDHDPMFMTPAMVGKTAWFVTFKGNIHGLDLANTKARDLGVFAMPKEKTAQGEWRPGGWQVISADAAGRLYVLMNPAGKEGSHKDGGSEVWVVDPAKKQRVARIPLQTPAVSIEVTAQPAPLLVASRTDGSLDVYDGQTGAFQRTQAQVVHDPMTMTASR